MKDIKRYKIFLLKTVITLMIAVLYACGSGGGGGDDEGNGGISFTGSTEPAEINTGNARNISRELLEESLLGIDMNSIILEDAFAETNSRFKKNLSGVVRSESGEFDGECGGRVEYEINYDDTTGEFDGTFNFNNYCHDGKKLSGNINLSGKIDMATEELLNFDYSFDNFTYSNGDDSFTMKGDISVAVSSFSVEIEMDMLLKNNRTEKVYKYENYVGTITEMADYYEIEIKGRYYDPDNGYLDISTPIPLRFYGNDNWPSQGEITCSGRSDARVRLTALSSTQYRVEADTDGDGAYNDYDSGPVNWSGEEEDDEGVNSAPVADAGDDKNAITNSVVTLDGSGSTDEDGDPLSYTWSFTSKPSNSDAVLSDPDAVTTTFTADVQGTYVISLTVNDGTVNSQPDEVTIEVFEVEDNFLSLNAGDGRAEATDTVFPRTSTAESFTVEAWIYPTEAEGSYIATDDAYDFVFYYQSGDVANDGLGIRFVVYDNSCSSASLITEFRDVELNQWNHVAGMFDASAGELKIAINGILSSTPDVFSGDVCSINEQNFTVGGLYGNSEGEFDGGIDEVRVSRGVRYNSDFDPLTALILTPDENTEGLWHFNEAQYSTSFADSSGNGHTLTGINNAYTYKDK